MVKAVGIMIYSIATAINGVQRMIARIFCIVIGIVFSCSAASAQGYAYSKEKTVIGVL